MKQTKKQLSDAVTQRRDVLGGLTAFAGIAALPACAAAQPAIQPASLGNKSSNGFDYNDPAANVRAMARLAGDLDPTKQGRVHYSGRAFAVIPGKPVTPIYGIEGLGSTRNQKMADGSYRFLFNEFAVYTDMKTGEPLKTWKSPLTDETLDVWHQRNGPVNFALRPNMNAFGAFDAVDTAPAFKLPWVVNDDIANFALDVTSNRPNPLNPEEWPMASSGATMHISEHSQYFVDTAKLADESITNLPFHAALQSQKPWHPWMMSGQRDGYVFTRMVARKVPSIKALPEPVARFAQSELSAWIDAPKEWTGGYATAHSIYAKTMNPR